MSYAFLSLKDAKNVNENISVVQVCREKKAPGKRYLFSVLVYGSIHSA